MRPVQTGDVTVSRIPAVSPLGVLSKSYLKPLVRAFHARPGLYGNRTAGAERTHIAVLQAGEQTAVRWSAKASTPPHPGRAAAAAPSGRRGSHTPASRRNAARSGRRRDRRHGILRSRGGGERATSRGRAGPVKQIRVHGPDDVRLDDVPPTPPGPRDAVVRMAACGICGTDVSFVHMGGITGRPMPLGHEMAGVVEWAGAEVGDCRARRPGHRPPGRRGAGPAGQRSAMKAASPHSSWCARRPRAGGCSRSPTTWGCRSLHSPNRPRSACRR